MKITVQLARTFLDNFEGRDFLDNKGSIAKDKIWSCRFSRNLMFLKNRELINCFVLFCFCWLD